MPGAGEARSRRPAWSRDSPATAGASGADAEEHVGAGPAEGVEHERDLEGVARPRARRRRPGAPGERGREGVVGLVGHLGLEQAEGRHAEDHVGEDGVDQLGRARPRGGRRGRWRSARRPGRRPGTVEPRRCRVVVAGPAADGEEVPLVGRWCRRAAARRRRQPAAHGLERGTGQLDPVDHRLEGQLRRAWRRPGRRPTAAEHRDLRVEDRPGARRSAAPRRRSVPNWASIAAVSSSAPAGVVHVAGRTALADRPVEQALRPRAGRAACRRSWPRPTRRRS